MIRAIDHIVIQVRNLEAASADYAALGFTVTPGGEHADGKSRNALITFRDGTYLELIEFRGPLPPEHLFFTTRRESEGMISYALLPDDIDATVEEAQARGLDMAQPTSGGRIRPDGAEIRWKNALAPSRELPFLCADLTPRELRVPGGAASEHPNSTTGISGIIVAVSDLDASTERYRALLGTEPQMAGQAAPGLGGYVSVFRVGNTQIILVEPVEEPILFTSWETGEGPYSLLLQADPSVWAQYADPSLVYGVRMQVTAPNPK